ncbi:hypothetical protein KKE06_02360 [Candidatus Micrarchaeota archaeon]|nr:hypothetical protein [Candidatus Micrarchaeota archaeon]MBU1930344.1 hypothetical protein [Candidatus Micrarchaeota archaeon]
MPPKPTISRRFGFLAQLTWIPIVLSVLMVVVFVPVVLWNGVLCLDSFIDVPLFVAYVGLFAFPLVAFLANWWANKRFSVEFETKHKEILVSFWIWTVLAVWLLLSFWISSLVPLPGFDVYFVC